MLLNLSIRDVVLIDRLDLEFQPGLCALTGETGAGKSILLVAGPPSHAPGCHEHPAGCELLAHHLRSSGLEIDRSTQSRWMIRLAEKLVPLTCAVPMAAVLSKTRTNGLSA